MSFDLWADEDSHLREKLAAPKKTAIAPGWETETDKLPCVAHDAARRRPYNREATFRPNKRAAVPLPVAGQSYNPSAEDYQAAADAAVAQLLKKKKAGRKICTGDELSG